MVVPNFVSAADITGQQWINKLLQANQNLVKGMTHAKFFSFMRSYLAVAETEQQGQCAICMDQAPLDNIEEKYAKMGYVMRQARGRGRGGICEPRKA